MFFLALLTSLQLALANPIGLKQHNGRFETERGLRALIIKTPGWEHKEYSSLLAELGDYGFEIWTQDFPKNSQRPEEMKKMITQAMNIWPKGSTLMIGHGFAGSIMAEAALEGNFSPNSMALIGVPLSHRCNPALKSLLKIEASITEPEKLLYGDVSVLKTSPDWTDALRKWCEKERKTNLEKIQFPVWVAASGLDNIAPPENVRPMIGKHHFLRVGPLSFHRTEPDHGRIMHHKPTLFALRQWSYLQLRSRP